jgi:replication initiator protein RepSA
MVAEEDGPASTGRVLGEPGWSVAACPVRRARAGRAPPAQSPVAGAQRRRLDAIGDGDEPWHVARFGARFDAQGVLAGSADASRCIGYLTKYLTKQLGDCHQAATGA